MDTTRVEVTTTGGSYPVYIAAGAVAHLGSLIEAAAPGSRRFVVSSPPIWKRHGRAFEKVASAPPVLIPDGERHKTAVTVNKVYEALLEAKADRSAVVIAVGGGVIGDLVGFAAATFLRGVRLVQVPTTLLAQVDSAIGGKVGINHPLGKNLIGAFHHPLLVVSDPDVLGTLARREFRAGLYEVVKYGVIADAALFDRIGAERDAIFAREPRVLADIIATSCRIKAAVVSADEREAGPRRALNFGHTLGHALEAVTSYKRFRHGEAIAYGMLAAMALGVARGVTPPDAEASVRRLITALGPLPPVADLSAGDLIAAAGHDKKIVAGTLHFVAASGIGSTVTLTDVTPQDLRGALAAIGVGRR
ncbi:MAG: 3-dehydroquinate synthase [Acidobacteriota bacterium]